MAGSNRNAEDVVTGVSASEALRLMAAKKPAVGLEFNAKFSNLLQALVPIGTAVSDVPKHFNKVLEIEQTSSRPTATITANSSHGRNLDNYSTCDHVRISSIR